MIDIQRYLRLQESGLTNIIKEGEKYFLTFKRFSVEDGSELPSERQEILLDELTTKKTNSSNEVIGIDEIFSKIDKLNSENKE